MKEDILKEIDYNLKKVYEILDLTENSDKDQHLIALGKQMALANLKYSIKYDDWEFKKKGADK